MSEAFREYTGPVLIWYLSVLLQSPLIASTVNAAFIVPQALVIESQGNGDLIRSCVLGSRSREIAKRTRD
jgi:hypothetical protein